ncbi:MAG: AAA family ATPase, partial [Phycisphaerae bacterium]
SLGRKSLQIKRLKSQVELKHKRLKETRFRVEQLNVESGVSGRINIVSRGDEPLLPSKDKRKQMAAAGGVGGMFVGFGLVAFLGMCDRRLRYISDAKQSAGDLPMLGILPRLPDDLSRTDQAQLAAGCVHHIRTMLQIQMARYSHAAISVTGPVQGSGKTSLSLALGLSFVEAGMRTLLIDADLAGAGLTRRTNVMVRRRLGQILRGTGKISHEQLESALEASRNGEGRLGEILIQRGVISGEDITDALQQQEQSQLGLVDAVGEEADLSECVAETEYDGLSVLPVGRACLRDVSRLSPARLSKLIREAKGGFDLVIVDTGPVMGGVEATAIAATVDSVVLTVAQGDSRLGIDRAIEQLNTVGANVAGVVFNRARESDVEQSSFSSASLRSAPAEIQPYDEDPGGNGKAAGSDRFGPLPAALVRRSNEDSTN